MMTFPGLDGCSKELFEAQRKEITREMPAPFVEDLLSKNFKVLSSQNQALKQALVQIDLDEAQAGLKNSVAGRLGVALTGITRYAGFD
jgi:ferrous iron transport protein B